MADRCAHCKQPLGRSTGESQLYGSHHTLCEPCWLDEDDFVESEGTNSAERSAAIKARLDGYGPPNSERR